MLKRKHQKRKTCNYDKSYNSVQQGRKREKIVMVMVEDYYETEDFLGYIREIAEDEF